MNNLDDLARDLASGTISRRTALRRLAAGALGIGLAAAPSALAEELERGGCPKSRRCGNKCCPKGAKCQNGKCKCKTGRVKCKKKCCAPGEVCESGQCVAPDLCGNGLVDPGEDCDGSDLGGMTCLDVGFLSGTLACASDCTFDTSGCANATCGDGVIDVGEECDGNNLNGQTCQSLGFDGGTLACDGNCGFDTSGCTTDLCEGVVCQALDECHVAGTCNPETGNCSNPAQPDGTPCTGGTCTNGTCIGPDCGNGIVDPGETCDDGNTQNGDGCSSTCQEELGWDCTGSPSVCVTTCGDGVVAAGAEECDDGNNTGGDGCSPTCQVEDGWICVGSPSVCTPV